MTFVAGAAATLTAALLSASGPAAPLLEVSYTLEVPNFHVEFYHDPGTSMPVAVSYGKVDRDPSITPRQADATPGVHRPRTMRNVLAFAAVLLVAVGAYVLFFTSDRRDRDDYLDEIQARWHGSLPFPPPAPSRYCTDCGQALAVADRYCSTCGHPVNAMPAPVGAP